MKKRDMVNIRRLNDRLGNINRVCIHCYATIPENSNFQAVTLVDKQWPKLWYED